MPRAVVIAANWKMNKTQAEATAFLDALLAELPAAAGLETWLAPVAVHLVAVVGRCSDTPLLVASQNAHGQSHGAFTGEIAAVQLADLGAAGAILGHSERRQMFGETDAGVAARLTGVVAAGLTGIVCIGEDLAARDQGRTLAVLEAQLEGSLAGFEADQVGRLRVAYEPVWAIGTGRQAELTQVDEAHGFIRGWLERRFGYNPGSSVPILYGGSVKPEGAPALLDRAEVDGFLIGGASLDPGSFRRLVETGAAVAAARTRSD